MPPIPMPLSSSPGYLGLQESSGRLINLYAVPLGEQRGAKRVRVPGLTSFLTSDQTGFRGMYSVEGTLYVAFADKLYTGTQAGGAMTLYDDLPGTGSVYFAINNAVDPDVCVVTENGAFLIDDPSAPGAIIDYSVIDADLPIPSSVFSLDGYLLFTIGDGRIFASGLNVTTVDALSFGTLEAKPDQPVRGVAFAGRALFFGSQTLEVWTDVGTSPFPLQRAAVVPFGLLGPDAVSGWEDGWGAGLLWVAHDGSVRQLDGYTANKVSPPDLDRLIAREANPSALMASVYMVDGHAMWTITGSDFSWSYDLTVQKWHERESYLTNRWRGLQTWNAFGHWLVGDRGTPDVYNPGEYLGGGNIYRIDPTNHQEAGEPLRARLESGPVQQFPQRVRVARADFNLETGVGIATGTDPIQTDPTVEISWSDDGGLSWSNPHQRKLGRQDRDTRISVFRTGMSSRHGRRWRLDISDPVYVSIMSGDQSAELRRG